MEHFMRGRLMILSAGFCVAALLTLAGASFFYYFHPTRLKIAVAPRGSNDERMVVGIAHRLNADGASIRLSVLQMETPADVVKAFELGDADVAILRSDFPVPPIARSVALFHHDVVLLAAPPDSKIRSFSDLVGKTVGVVGPPGTNDGILQSILRQYSIPTATVRIVGLKASELRQAFKDKRVDLAMAVGPLDGRPLTELGTALAGGRRAPVFLEIAAAPAIATKLSGFETSEIVAGIFGGNPPQPARSITTLGFRHYLVVRQDLRDGTVTELARQLFNMRPNLMIDFPSTDRIEALDIDKGEKIPAHPGALAYYNGDERTFFDLYGDPMYFGVFALGLLGSAIGWGVRRARPDSGSSGISLLESLMVVSRNVRHATALKDIEDLERQADSIYGLAAQLARKGSLDQTQLTVFALMVENVRQSVAERAARGKDD